MGRWKLRSPSTSDHLRKGARRALKRGMTGREFFILSLFDYIEKNYKFHSKKKKKKI